MAMKRFVEAAGRKSGYGYVGDDRIPGTNKIRTYCANASLYSKESDLRKITSSQYRTTGTKKEH
ncbi:MAG: hypothetical protein ACI3V4_12835 [Faecousia sp.]